VLVLRDSDPEVRTAALEAVGRLRDAAAVWSVVAELADTEEAVRAAAALALARLATPAALSALLAELDREAADPEPIVRALVLAGPAALPPLRACVESTTTRGRVEGCARALGALGDESDVTRLRGALASGTIPPLIALPVLASLGGPAAVPAVLEYLASPDAAVRHNAAFALADLIEPGHPDGRAVDPLLQAFRARGATLVERALLVRLLGRTGEARVGRELERVARETTAPGLAASALLALGDLGAGSWEPTLLAKLDAEDGSVRMAAALALRRSASASAFGALLARLARGAEQDRLALGVALPGASRASRDARHAKRLLAELAKRTEGERDALLEAWAELEAPAAPDSRELDAADRRKLAEVLGGRARHGDRLAALARDADPSVRANAAWSLGYASTPTALDELARLLADRDALVVANAAAAVGRLGRRLERDVSPLLCPLTGDARAVVRANAAAALGLAGKACAPGTLERLLATDPSARVRRALARTLAQARRTPEVGAALERCAAEDASPEVAEECLRRPLAAPERVEPVLVFVVPTGAAGPTTNAAFALRLADGTERFGVADRRGAVFERQAAAGTVELGVLPAAGE
jgi:HEAT repeat protein